LKTVLVDAGPLIALGKLKRLDLLTSLFGVIHVPRSVYSEVVLKGLSRGAPDAHAVYLFLEDSHGRLLEASAEILAEYAPSIELGAGERELLGLAQAMPDPLVLLDDGAARSEARRLGLQVRGTLGVLVEAYRSGFLARPELETLLLEVAARPDIWISERLCQEILARLD
jgi:predicted nucleic acid-binding protein